MADSYVTAGDAQAMLVDTDWTATYTELLDMLGERASRVIDRVTGREPGAYQAGLTPAARLFDGYGGVEQWVDEMAAAPTLVEVDEGGVYTYTTWTTSDYTVWPYNGTPYRRLDILRTGSHARWPSYSRSVRVAARWGYSLVPPADIAQAATIQTVRYFKRAQQAFQDTGAVIDLGQLRYVKELDPDVALMVAHYRRMAI